MRKGITIMEVIISTTLLTMIAAIVFPTISWLITKSHQLEYENQAVLISSQNLEVVYNVLQENWDGVNFGDVYQPAQVADINGRGKWTILPGHGRVQTNFDRWIEVQQVCRDHLTGERKECQTGDEADPRSKMLVSIVQWPEREITRSVTNELLVIKL